MPIVSKQYSNGTYYAAEFDETPFIVDILGVGAGGGGGSIHPGLYPGGGGGGGAGGLFYRKFSLQQGSYTVVVGGGGVGGVQGTTASGNGSNTSISGIINGSSNTWIGIGGGGGGTQGFNRTQGVNGGSGGGAAVDITFYDNTAGSGLQPESVVGGLGNRGGYHNSSGGGGGGAGAVGGNGRGSGAGGLGGNGVFFNITGNNTPYAGGGGAGGGYSVATGGVGGGGNTDTSGVVNTGGGGGGATGAGTGGSGGSGILIISYPGAQFATGGTITTNGSNTVHTFTSTGTFTIGQVSKLYSNGSLRIASQLDESNTSFTGSVKLNANGTLSVKQIDEIGPVYVANILVAGGGGGGGGSSLSSLSAIGGGGGAGGLYVSNTLIMMSGLEYAVVIGSGGAGGTQTVAGSPGSNTTFTGQVSASAYRLFSNTITAIGGGGAQSYTGSGRVSIQNDGGSGAGGTYAFGSVGGRGSGLQPSSLWGGLGNQGGLGSSGGSAGGGGGAGGVGFNGEAGAGYSSTITGTSVTYCRGGDTNNGVPTTWGGGGGGRNAGSGGNGISGNNGIVIIAYNGPQRGTGGTVSTNSTYTVHTFTSSGTYIA